MKMGMVFWISPFLTACVIALPLAAAADAPASPASSSISAVADADPRAGVIRISLQARMWKASCLETGHKYLLSFCYITYAYLQFVTVQRISTCRTDCPVTSSILSMPSETEARISAHNFANVAKRCSGAICFSKET